MQRHGFRSDVEPGGLYDSNDIKILVCYVLSNLGEPVTLDTISNIIREYGLANYFEITQAVSELTELGNLVLSQDGAYTVTEAGCKIAEMLSDTLPFTVREKALKSAQKALRALRTLKDNKVEINRCDSGYIVTIVIPDHDLELLRVQLYADDLEQANTIRERFLEKPLALYLNNLNLLLGYQI